MNRKPSFCHISRTRRTRPLLAPLTRWLSGRAGSGVNPLDRWSILRPISSGLIVALISLALSRRASR